MSTLSAFLCCILVADTSPPAAPETGANALSAARIAELLAAHTGALPIPELSHPDLGALAAREPGKSALAWAKQAPDNWPRTSYSLYRSFKRTGERPPYEKPYFEKRELLTRAALAAWLGESADLDRVSDLIWSICEETTWVLPAHERPEPYYLDLFASETGSDLAHVLYVLGPRLPEEVRLRALREIESRILQPYAEHATWYSWREGSNNWTGVCAGSIGETFLLCDTDPARQAGALAHVLEQLGRFIERGFEPDGGCLEGVGYWNYGLLHYVTFGEMLRARTGGQIDLLSQPKLAAIARYPQVVALGKNAFASFADSHEESSLNPVVAGRLAERTGEKGLLGFAGSAASWRFVSCLRTVLWWDGNTPAAPAMADAYLPESAIAKRVATASGRPVVLVAKAGHNAEPHNHNDVGSFVLRVGDTTYLCDPGAGLYSKDYFGAKRYQNIFCSSYGHSVPRIGGQEQRPGPAFRGHLEAAPETALRVGFEKAYDVASLRHATRALSLDAVGTGRIADTFQFDGAGIEVEEAFVTWLPVEISGSIARLIGGDGVLELRANGATFAVESLREACEANHIKKTLTRLTLSYPAKPEILTQIEFTFQPK